MHSDLPKATKLRGYYQINSGTTGTTDNTSQYLGPLILATKDRPVRILFQNNLPVSGAAGQQPLHPGRHHGHGGRDGSSRCRRHPLRPAINNPNDALRSRRTAPPSISTAATPRGSATGRPTSGSPPRENPTPFKKGQSFQNVPDMVGPGKSIPATGGLR